MGSTAQRVVAVVMLLTAGILSLPLAAAVLDGRRTENWIVPVQLLVMAAVGATITVALPAMARAGASTGVRALTGMAWGLLAAFTGLLVFWLLLNGFRGA
ncbi:MAG: hypothetical protein ABR500_10540 [Dermatophilaceae bacterium]|nr:hypothetical protein [Intrasporangiaceae bacterium]